MTVGSTDIPAVENGNAAKSTGTGVIFTKRSRGRKARKRARAALSDEEGVEAPRVGSLPRKEPRKESKEDTERRWGKEAFNSGTRTADQENRATAERLDVGGGKPGSTQETSKKPFGPLSAPSHLRTSVRVDYQPDVCKDYKETGYCGFGDSCKFLHDRSDYKAGWQLDKEWAETEKRRRERMMSVEDPDEQDLGEKQKDFDDEGLPFACFICREDFKRPVMTLCAHYFCEECILAKMESSSACPVCKKPLKGTLNPAPKLQRQLERRLDQKQK